MGAHRQAFFLAILLGRHAKTVPEDGAEGGRAAEACLVGHGIDSPVGKIKEGRRCRIRHILPVKDLDGTATRKLPDKTRNHRYRAISLECLRTTCELKASIHIVVDIDDKLRFIGKSNRIVRRQCATLLARPKRTAGLNRYRMNSCKDEKDLAKYARRVAELVRIAREVPKVRKKLIPMNSTQEKSASTTLLAVSPRRFKISS